MTRNLRRALLGALATTFVAVAPAAAQTAEPGKPLYDSRESRPLRPAAPGDAAALHARDRLNAQLGRQGVVDLDGRTGTPRMVARLDGFLTGPSGGDAAQIALDYVTAQRGVFGLSDRDLAALRLVRRYTDDSGITHLTWAQTWRGITAWDNELRASVTADGRLVNVGGSPVPGLASRTPTPELGASEALSTALDDADSRALAPRATPHGGADRRTTFAGGHSARLVLFTERRGDVHLAWDVRDQAREGAAYEHLIDARSGDLLYRESLTDGLTASVDVFPNAPDRSTQTSQTVPVDSTGDLAGPNARAYRDANDNDVPDGATPANANGNSDWSDAFTVFNGAGCAAVPCSWEPTIANSWTTNQRQNAANVYYFVNTFHDWLRDQVGFTAASGAFEGNDRVNAEVLDGASTGGNGRPDANHRDNAFMVTPPDGSSPLMAMFLWTDGRNGGDDATVVYHEYTHGLSSRLITRPNGAAALGPEQSGALGEGWSDWYALDYLVENGLESDDPATPGQLGVGEYAADSPTGVRDAAIDCPVPAAVATCSSGRDTYGDFRGDEPHVDSEIWSQTLWDLRTALGGNGTGAQTARRLITEAMRLSPDDPSFLDERNAILQADQALNAGANRDTIWHVFAARGMGFGAFSRGGADRTPAQSFTEAPASGGGVTVTGRVTDATTGAPVSGALVEFASLPGDGTALTNTNGDYSIGGMATGDYPVVTISAPGYEIVARSVSVGAGGGRVDQQVRRNFAASSGGATVGAFTGPDFTADACGPQRLMDGSQQTGWGSTSHTNSQSPGEKSVTIALPAAVDVSAVRVDPGAVCGDDDAAAAGAIRVETSADGQTFTAAASRTFDSAASHRMNEVAVDRGGVRYVRYVMQRPQSQASGTSGVAFMDSAEFEVLGQPTGAGTGAQTPAPAGGAGTGAVGGTTTTAPPPLDLTAPIARLSLAPRQRLATALAKGLKISVSCNEACSGPLSATLDARTAKKLRLLSRKSRAKTVKVAAGSLRSGSGKRTATLRFTSRARKLLKRQKRLKLAVTARLSDAAANRASRTLNVALKR